MYSWFNLQKATCNVIICPGARRRHCPYGRYSVRVWEDTEKVPDRVTHLNIIREAAPVVKRFSLSGCVRSYSSDVARATEHMETPKPRPPQASVVNESER